MNRRWIACLVVLVPVSLGAQSPAPVQAAIPGVIAANARIELVMSGFRALEGPLALPDGGVYFNDTNASRTYRVAPSGVVSLAFEHTNGTNGMAWMADGRLLRTERDGRRVAAVAPNGETTPVATSYHGRPFLGPNDLIPDAKGGIYFTDQSPLPGPGQLPPVSGAIYYMRPDGETILIDDGMLLPNGITLSLDGKTLYAADTEDVPVFAYDVQPDGSVAHKRPFVNLQDPKPYARGTRTLSDGIAIDSEGRLYVSIPAGVEVVDASGRSLGVIRIPGATAIRNLAFAGPQHRTLYVLDRNAVYRVDMLSRSPINRSK